jgi:insulysin
MAADEGVARRCDTFRKPELDERSYRWLALHNKLEVLLISDSQADKAAAAMDVAVGHASDPEELPGLAHFLEHMLFLGTDKYPDEGSYQQFLSEHGGSSNAFTAFENTNYYFDVTQPHLHDALDRFAQFFLCPCFTESATSRELKAVDSENAKNLQADNWRLMQLYKSTADPAHPFHKFGTGNLSTLRDRPEDVVGLELRAAPGGEVALKLTPQHRAPVSVRDSLFAFHAKHYSANAMRLVVVGREDLDTLQAWVVPLFSAVPNTDRLPPVWATLPYGAAQLGRELKVVPVRDLRTLSVWWALPPLRPLYRSKPHRILSHLLGHEGDPNPTPTPSPTPTPTPTPTPNPTPNLTPNPRSPPSS